jgi:hypothetical protein
VAQGVGPEFKPLDHKKNKIKRSTIPLKVVLKTADIPPTHSRYSAVFASFFPAPTAE